MTDNVVTDTNNQPVNAAQQNPIQDNQSQQPETVTDDQVKVAISDQNEEDVEIQIPDEASKFLNALLDETGLSLTDDVREDMVKELYIKLDGLLTARIIDTLPDDKVDAFLDMQEKNSSPDEIQQFVQTNLPNASDLFTAVLTEFRDMYLTNVDIARADKDVSNAQSPQQTDTLEAIAAGKHDSMQQ